MKTLLPIVIIISIFVSLAFAAEYRGLVIEAGTRKALPSVNVFVKNTKVGTTTDESGYFFLKTKMRQGVLVIEHIGYEIVETPLASYQQNSVIELLPKIIETQGVQIESEYEPIRIIRDLPQTYKIMKSETFEIRGYIDAGDLLKTEQSVQISEEMSGEKKVSIRSGNADDVIVLYNGIKLNNSYDNTFDLSLINLDQVEHIEVIKGSNSSLYGAEGFSGVINILPKTERDYYARFQQQFGSYNSGMWNLQLNYSPLERLLLSYTQKRSGAQRRYSEAAFQDDFMQNDVLHHSANIRYQFTEQTDNNIVDLMYFRTEGDYENTRQYESLEKSNEMIGVSFHGDIAFFKRIHFTGAVQNLLSDQFIWLQQDYVDRRADNQSLSLNIDKRFVLQHSEFLLGYQLEDAELDFQDKRRIRADVPMGVETALMQQQKHGFLAIAKYHAPTESAYLTGMDFDAGYRYDTVDNSILETMLRKETGESSTTFFQIPESRDWSTSTIRFSAQVHGQIDEFKLNGFFNSGTNVKFPSLFQQLSMPMAIGEDADFIYPNLNPEKNSSMEIGFHVNRQLPNTLNVDSYRVEASYFQNNYTNKFRMYYLQGIPLAFYDNIVTARISGFEINGHTQLFNNKISAQVGVSKYDISSKAAFPFKSDLKVVCNLGYQHKGSSLQFHWFLENEQIGWIRDETGAFYQLNLDAHSNIDLHASQEFKLAGIKYFINASVRNLIKDDTIIEGIAIRDRRIYLTFGVQY